MRVADIRAAADQLRAQLAAIDDGHVDATSTERAFIAGAVHALGLVTGDVTAPIATYERPGSDDV